MHFHSGTWRICTWELFAEKSDVVCKNRWNFSDCIWFLSAWCLWSEQILGKERRLPFHLDVLAMSPLTALLMGFTFSFAWTPCVGPALTSVLLMAASAGTKWMGFALIGVYTLGFVLPFLVLGLFTTSFWSC